LLSGLAVDFLPCASLKLDLDQTVRFAGPDNGFRRFGQLTRAKEDLNVLPARRFHLSKFSDGRPSDIHLYRVVLAIDHRFFRSVPSP
jgi:hypothetical protein